MIAGKVILVASLFTILAGALIAFFSISNSSIKTIDIVAKYDNTELYMLIEKESGIVQYDIISDMKVIDDVPQRLLTRFSSSSMTIQEVLFHDVFINATSIWSQRDIDDSFIDADIHIGNSNITIKTDKLEVSIELHNGIPIKFGNYEVTSFNKNSFNNRPTVNLLYHETARRRLSTYQSLDAVNILKKEINIDENSIQTCFRTISNLAYNLARDGDITKNADNVVYVFGNGITDAQISLWNLDINLVRRLNTFGDCSFLPSNTNIVGFEGTKNIGNIISDIRSISDNFKDGYLTIQKWHDDKRKFKNSGVVFDYCTGHSLGGTRAQWASMDNMCKRVITFGNPHMIYNPTIPITQFSNVRYSTSCCYTNWWSWTCDFPHAWHIDPVSQIGPLDGNSYNEHYNFVSPSGRIFPNINQNCINSIASGLFGGSVLYHPMNQY